MQDSLTMAIQILDSTRAAELREIQAALERCAQESHTVASVTKRVQIVTNSQGAIEVSATLGGGAKDVAPRCLMQFQPAQLALYLSDVEEAA